MATACVAVVLSLKNNNLPLTTSQQPPVLRGGQQTPPGTIPGVSWQWIGASEFGAEQARLAKEGFAEEIANATVSITLDAQADPKFVLVTGAKNGVSQPGWSTRLPKLPADAQRPDRWLQSLLQIQEKIDATP